MHAGLEKSFTILIILLGFGFASFGQRDEQQQILSILDRQTKAWNRGDVDAFMVGYWEHDSLMYIGKSGVTYGYAPTLRNYKKNYSDTAQMGRLSFTILHVNRLSPEYYFVVGKWFLKRSVGDIGGHYTLLFRKINGKWVIVADHSS
jgi:ketosteroid isomerase-like protein